MAPPAPPGKHKRVRSVALSQDPAADAGVQGLASGCVPVFDGFDPDPDRRNHLRAQAMAYWKKCPECGETNYEEDVSDQKFDCGFVGRSFSNSRHSKCKAAKRARPATKAPATFDEVARYRLALLDAARVAEGIGADMARGGSLEEFADRIRLLAEQMQEFAGHGADPTNRTFQDVSSTRRKPGNALTRLVRKARPW